jgi:hypothetical protein
MYQYSSFRMYQYSSFHTYVDCHVTKSKVQAGAVTSWFIRFLKRSSFFPPGISCFLFNKTFGRWALFSAWNFSWKRNWENVKDERTCFSDSFRVVIKY